MDITKLDALEAHGLAIVELRQPRFDSKRFGQLVERMIADGGTQDERTWRYAGQLYEKAGWTAKAIAAYTRCRECGNASVAGAIARMHAAMPAGGAHS